jgi:hypothetical protein
MGGFRVLRVAGRDVPDVTAAGCLSATVVAYSVSPLYGEPGVYIYDFTDRRERRLVSAENRSDAYPKGADYFELKELDDRNRTITFYYARDVDTTDFGELRTSRNLRKVDLHGQVSR